MSRFRLFASAACAMVAAVAVGSASAQTSSSLPVHPLWGDIDAFWGDIDAFWGDIDAFEGSANPFWGDIDAFWGDIDAFEGAANPFWGDIDAFWGDIDAFSGTLAPKWGDIDAFWGDIDAFQGSVSGLWGNIDAFWGDIDAFEGNVAAYEGLRTNLDLLISRSRSFWGPSVEAQTGRRFDEAFVSPLLAKYGIRLDDPASFSGFSGVDRTRFFFDWYDGLMAYSGRDHVDWWMPMVGWTPKLTQQVGTPTGAKIGLVDFSLTDADLQDNLVLVKKGGYQNAMTGHGDAVASLLVAAHDGRGVMGTNPNAQVYAANPFDTTGTAGWDDLASSLDTLAKTGARVVNLSLGVPGFTLAPEWRDLYSRAKVRNHAGNTVFVHAAGNEGVAQTQNISWNFAADPSLIIVGSVGPSGEISSFSNTPGTACLLDNGVCRTPLRNRFMVAPGEWILVSDGQGGVTRRSGTSFAAPLVTGAIALAQDRWSWLKLNPDETVELMFRTATDLGTPGVDDVYGHGRLNIAGTQRPINWSALYQRVVSSKGAVTKVAVRALPVSGPLADASVSHITVYEDIGDTFRDFRLPVSAILAPATSTTTSTLQTLASKTTSTTTTTKTTTTKTKTKAFELANPFGWALSGRSFAIPAADMSAQHGLVQGTELAVTSRSGVELQFGNGVGAMALSEDAGASAARFSRNFGGANPILGLASGGGFARVAAPVPGGATLAIGATGRAYRESYADPTTGELRRVQPDIATYRSRAAHLSLSQPVGQRLAITAGYTLLRESNAVLGVQSTHPLGFGDGSLTDAATLAADWSVSDRISFGVTGTVSGTRAQAAGSQVLAVADGGIQTTSLEAALTASRMFLRGDSARIALVQPMHVESGGYVVSEMTVTDRATGELGASTRFIGAGDAARELALEVSYGTSFLDGQARAGAFLRAEGAMAGGTRETVDHMIGGQLSFGF